MCPKPTATVEPRKSAPGYKQKYNMPTSYTRYTPDSGPGGAKPSTSLLMTFSGLSLPSKRSATFWAATRPMRNIDSTVTPEWGLTRMLSSPKADATGLAKESDGDRSSPELGIFRVWSFTFESPVIFPETFSSLSGDFDINSYPMTDSARAALADFNLVEDNPTQNCTPKGMPTIMEQPYPIEFIQQDENIALRIEESDLVRTIYMGASNSPEEQPASPLGYSVGRWEGDTLIATTTRIDWPYFDQSGIPQSEAVEIVERFTPSSDGSRLDYKMTVTDPATFTEPVEQEKYWLRRPQETVQPFNCLAGD